MCASQLKTQQIPVPRSTNKHSIPWFSFTPGLSEFLSPCLQFAYHFLLVFSSVFCIIISLEFFLLEWPGMVVLLNPGVTFQLFFKLIYHLNLTLSHYFYSPQCNLNSLLLAILSWLTLLAIPHQSDLPAVGTADLRPLHSSVPSPLISSSSPMILNSVKKLATFQLSFWSTSRMSRLFI